MTLKTIYNSAMNPSIPWNETFQELVNLISKIRKMRKSLYESLGQSKELDKQIEHTLEYLDEILGVEES